MITRSGKSEAALCSEDLTKEAREPLQDLDLLNSTAAYGGRDAAGQ